MQIEPFTFQELSEGVQPQGSVPRPFKSSARTKNTEPTLPPPPTFTQEDLKNAEREGYKKGFLEGTAEGRAQAESEQASTDRELKNHVIQFAQTIAPLFASHRQAVMYLKEHMPKVALAISRKVAGAALQDNAEAIIQEVTIQACEAMAHEPKLVVTVPETHADALENKLQEIGSKLPADIEIVIQRDPAMTLTDCRIDWQYGSVYRNTEQLWQQIEKVVGDMSITAKRDTQVSMDDLASNLSQPATNHPTQPTEKE